jgi:hypothetical protein
MLERTYACLKPGGLHFLEVPNIENVRDSEIVEEFFIDKHSFHFSRDLLVQFVKANGFEVVAGEDAQDKYNITLLLRKSQRPSSPITNTLESPWRVQEQSQAIRDYVQCLATNRSLLKKVAMQIEEIATVSKVALWGGGRIFDALVRFGDLDTRKLLYTVDTFIGRHLTEFHGLQIVLPEHLRENPPDSVVLLARSSSDWILSTLANLNIKKTHLFSTMLERARQVS